MPPRREGVHRVLLLVEPDASAALRIGEPLFGTVDVHTHRRFETARRDIASLEPDFVVANLRLGEFNGLHLAYIANAMRKTPCVVYTVEREPGMAREIQRSGAFYEIAERLPITLRHLMFSPLPAFDRRNAEAPDRRLSVRGGRRAWDLHVASA